MADHIKVEAKLFRAVDVVRSYEDTRYYLNGVYVQPHPERGAIMVATDGHRLMIAHDAEGVSRKSAIVQLDKAAYLPLKKEPDAKITVDADGIASCGFYKSEKSTFIDGTSPDWPRVIAPILAALKQRFYGKQLFEPASFNARYLADYKTINNILFPENKNTAVRIISYSKADAALILIPNDRRIFGVLMPMRAEIENALPVFLKPIF